VGAGGVGAYGAWSAPAHPPRRTTLGKLPGLDDEERVGWEEIGRILDGKPRREADLFRGAEPDPPEWARVDLARVRVERLRHFGDVYLGLALWRRLGLHLFFDSVMDEGHIATTAEGLSSLVASLKLPPGTPIALESGQQAYWVSRVLLGLGMKPVVIEAREVQAKARRINHKSDRRDAFELSDGLRRGIYTQIVYMPTAELQRLRTILSRRRHFVGVRTAQINAAKYLLHSVGLGQHVASLRTWHALADLAEPTSGFSGARLS
jgi:hypothetical protein